MYELGLKVCLQYVQEILQEFKLEVDWNMDEGIFVQLEDVLVGVNNFEINKL